MTAVQSRSYSVAVERFRLRTFVEELVAAGECLVIDEPVDRRQAAAPPSRQRPTASHEIADALSRLGDRDREGIALRFGGDLTGPEIAEVLGLTLANVQQILSRSLRKLRAILDEAGFSELRGEARSR